MVKRLQAKMLPTKKKDYAVQSLRGEIDRLEVQQFEFYKPSRDSSRSHIWTSSLSSVARKESCCAVKKPFKSRHYGKHWDGLSHKCPSMQRRGQETKKFQNSILGKMLVAAKILVIEWKTQPIDDKEAGQSLVRENCVEHLNPGENPGWG